VINILQDIVLLYTNIVGGLIIYPPLANRPNNNNRFV